MTTGLHDGRVDDLRIDRYSTLSARHRQVLSRGRAALGDMFGGDVEVASSGPWIHTASDVANLSVLRDGERVSARGRVARLEQRKGNEIVELDVLLVADDRRPVMAVRHSAIYALRTGKHTQ